MSFSYKIDNFKEYPNDLTLKLLVQRIIPNETSQKIDLPLFLHHRYAMYMDVKFTSPVNHSISLDYLFVDLKKRREILDNLYKFDAELENPKIEQTILLPQSFTQDVQTNLDNMIKGVKDLSYSS
jgi:hypothetical protein